MDKETKKAVRTLENKVNKAIKKHQLVEKGDKILIGLSGGVDSLVLLKTLVDRQRYYGINYDLIALHVKLTNISYKANRDALQRICDNYNVPLIWHEEKLNFNTLNSKKNICFTCSWHRRRILFNQAGKLGANKIALGHHRDDALETLLMNMIFHGSISSLPARLKMFKGKLTLIRPLIYVGKDTIHTYANASGLKNLTSPCPFANKSQRWQAIAQLLDQIQEINPAAKNNLMKSMGKIFEEYLPR